MGTILKTGEIQWLSDLHLDKAAKAQRESLYRKISSSPAGIVLITGDISTAKHLPLHLRELAAAASGKEVFFVLGNHDFYGASFAGVESCVAGVCRSHENLHHLGRGEIVPLGSGAALVGHRGWGDGRMGWGELTPARNPDFLAIEDFRGLDRPQAFGLLARLGRESASYFRRILPPALSCYRHVIIATHVPLFTWSAHFDRKPCDWFRQPFFVNISAGAAIMRIAGHFPGSKVTVLSGHTHCAASARIANNLVTHTGGAWLGYPAPEGFVEITSGDWIEGHGENTRTPGVKV